MTDKQKLAKKQVKVLNLLLKGKTPTQVAKAMKISVNGVYGHMRRIEAKGYDVPRKEPKTPSKAKPKKASPNGPVKAIDAEIEKLVTAISTRQKEIAKEALEIKGQSKALEERTEALLAETEALAQRQQALTAASA